MICSRCRRFLRRNEGLKCATCESKYHINCVAESHKDHQESAAGDRGYQWKCFLCQNYGKTLQAEKSEYKGNAHLFSAITSLGEKFELVNKLQLPKINSDLTHIKTITDSLMKQNTDIIHKIDDIDAILKNKEKKDYEFFQSYRKRNIKLNSNSNNLTSNEFRSILPNTEKPLRYRTRRRSYVLNKMFRLLNRNLTKHVSRRN
ncbi:hypothetical protein K1T71_000258 [Dendrolimus kikuchii]|uniref:Uncharacterized protein n=1 Tax=Dendrolimus kikuchii TaxID=765133 RepID=A0ACC1DJ65_9NEOP|nr:hypothetical protein K1T71_000258 [Dendrolimus kikuchii]